VSGGEARVGICLAADVPTVVAPAGLRGHIAADDRVRFIEHVRDVPGFLRTGEAR
jgi:hypothetical protein